jgi:hypothetical protein
MIYAIVAWLILPSLTLDQARSLKPAPNLPIDCNSNQVCTGTICVSQTKTVLCDDGTGNVTEVTCNNDTQEQSGGNAICCSDKTTCVTCYLRKRWTAIPEYTGTTSRSCTPNP